VKDLIDSLAWLFRWELKLQWRSFGRRRRTTAVIATMLVAWQLLALVIVFGIDHADLPAMPPPLPYAALTGALFFMFLGMASTALDAAIQAIYARGDMDLLLSSPFPRQAIILVRVAAIATGVCLGGALLALPLANAFIIEGHRGWLSAYVTIPCLGLLATAAGLIMTLGLFRLLGARLTRLVAQILSALLGITFALTAQVPNLIRVSDSTDLAGLSRLAESLPGPQSWLWWPARGVMGEGRVLAALTAISIGCFIAAALTLAERFIASAVAAAGIGTGAARNRAPAERPFRTEPLAALRRKELRLLLRDPWLLTQIARQLIFLLPLTLIVWRAQTGGNSGRWLVLIMTAGYMAGGLTWLTVSGEDARDLLISAPLTPGAVLRAKVQAALLPVALFMTVPLLVAAWFSLWLGFCLALCCTGSALCCAVLNYLYRVQARRTQFARRGADNLLRSLAELLIGVTWSITAFLLIQRSPWALVPAAVALLPLHRVLRRSSWSEARLRGTV
jgi:ABC-2 type transport system permease protein